MLPARLRLALRGAAPARSAGRNAPIRSAVVLAGLVTLVACGDGSADPGEPAVPSDAANATGAAERAPGASEPSGAALDPSRPGWRPNVVVYLIDTLRADRLGLYGHDRDTSPTIDAVGAESAVFERTYSQGPWTLPSVMSLFTSAYPTSHEMVSATFSLNESARTLTEWFAEQGYATAGFVHNTLGGKGSGLDQGYEHFVEKPPQRDMTDEMRAQGLHTMRPIMDYIRGYDDERPFFTYIHTVEPHWPYEGTIPDREPWTDTDPASWPELNELVYEQRVLVQQASAVGLTEDERARLLAGQLDTVWDLYDADIRRADVGVRRVTTALQATGHWDDTIFLLLSDHGEEFLEHGFWFHDQSVYEELVHVPFVLRVPGLTDAGARIDTPVQLLDVAPTLADLLGQPAWPQWQGRSLVPLLTDPRAAEDWPSAITMRINVDREMGGDRGDRETALVRGQHKLILHHDHEHTRLFDLAADPGEQHDLSAQQPGRAESLRRELFDRVRGLRPLGIRDQQEHSDELRQHLIELGYVEDDG